MKAKFNIPNPVILRRVNILSKHFEIIYAVCLIGCYSHFRFVSIFQIRPFIELNILS